MIGRSGGMVGDFLFMFFFDGWIVRLFCRGGGSMVGLSEDIGFRWLGLPPDS